MSKKAVSTNLDVNKDKHQFEYIIRIIETAREQAYRKVNEELILMYQKVGKYISEKTKESFYGENLVDRMADFF